jgi:hypothetical protein
MHVHWKIRGFGMPNLKKPLFAGALSVSLALVPSRVSTPANAAANAHNSHDLAEKTCSDPALSIVQT